MKNKWLYGCGLFTLIFLCLPITAWAADNPVGVSYRGHIQDLGDYPRDGSWVDSPEMIGTVGQSQRIEGFEIKLTRTVPEGMELRYNVHVQNKGWLYDENDWADWPKDGAYAGTRGDSLRIEAVKIVLTDRDGKAVPGYSVQYRGHVQNVGDLPTDKSQWLADGAQLGTVGSSQRLEALLVQVVKTAVEPPAPASVVYDKAGTFGPARGNETITGDATIAADGVVLQNMTIAGNLTISEAVGDGTVTLNNITVKGDTVVRGGGINSIKINGGEYSRIIMEKTASGAVRIVAIDVKGLPFFVSEAAAGETIILEGAFESVTVDAPNMNVTTQGNTTTIGKMTVGAGAGGSTVTVVTGTTVSDLVLDGKAAVKGQGNVAKAEVKADGVVFEKKPGSYSVEPGVVIPPVFPTPDSGGGGGGYTPPAPIAVTGVSLNKTALSLSVNTSETLIATVNPAGASNKAVSWTSSDGTVATVSSDGTVTGIKEGITEIDAFTQDGNKYADCIVTVKDLKPTIDGVTVPFAGESPVTTSAATSQYSGMVSWQKKDGSGLTALTDGEKFDGTSTYLATITLSLNSFIYTTEDITADFFTVAGATATNNAGALAITAEFVATEQYRITNDGIITAYSGSGGIVSVPATVNHTAVTGIGQNAFRDQTVITAITLPATVATIGDAAFAGCTNLTAVTFTAPSALKSIGVSAFDSCTALAKIAIPQSVTAIANGAFESCIKLTVVTFDDAADLNTIGFVAFGNCQLLQSMAIPDSVTSIGSLAFQDCPKLTAITFRGAAPSLGADAIVAGTIIRRYANETGFNAGGWSSYPQADILAQPELNPPTVTNTGTPVVKLEWQAVPGASSYDVYVREYPSYFTDVTLNVKTGTTAEITSGLFSGNKYEFAVKALDADGESLLSEVKSVPIPYPVPVTALSIVASPDEISIGSTGLLIATITPANATNQRVFWSSFNPSIAMVDDETGVITTVSPGVAKMRGITADGRFTKTCSVTVRPILVESVTLDKTALSVGVTQDVKLSATITPANATNPFVSWKSSDDSIATVGTDGTVKGLKEGSATITATTKDGNKTATCAVNVTQPTLIRAEPITAVAEPFVGLTPTTSFAVMLANGMTREYSGTVIWTETGTTTPVSTFDGSKAYTATLTLTAEPGYQFAAGTTFSVAGADSVNTTIGEYGLTATVTANYAVKDRYQIDDDGVITAYSGPGGELVVPGMIDGKTVVGLGLQVFYDKESLTKVTLPDTITEIGPSNFQSCLNLQEINIPKALTSIPVDCFNSCYNLETVTIPTDASFQTIGGNAFYLTKLKTMAIPATVTTIEKRAFEYCNQLTTVTIAANSQLQTIGEQAFDGTHLTTLILPKSLTSLGKQAFNECGYLTTLSFESGSQLEIISEKAFYGCSALTALELPKSVTTIGNEVFARNTALATLSFESGSLLSTIGDNAFGSCALTELNLPATVTAIGGNAFDGNKLTKVTLNNSDGVSLTIGKDAFMGSEEWGHNPITEITLPANVSIPDSTITGYATMGLYGTAFKSFYKSTEAGGNNSAGGTFVYNTTIGNWSKTN